MSMNIGGGGLGGYTGLTRSQSTNTIIQPREETTKTETTQPLKNLSQQDSTPITPVSSQALQVLERTLQKSLSEGSLGNGGSLKALEVLGNQQPVNTNNSNYSLTSNYFAKTDPMPTSNTSNSNQKKIEVDSAGYQVYKSKTNTSVPIEEPLTSNTSNQKQVNTNNNSYSSSYIPITNNQKTNEDNSDTSKTINPKGGAIPDKGR